MNDIENVVNGVQQNADSMLQYVKFLGILIVGFLLLSSLCKFIFKKSQLNKAVSSAVEILGLYVINIAIYALGLRWELFLSPLPFMSIENDTLTVFPILNADFTVICGQVLRILIIAFLVNILNDFIPKGKKIITWYFFRFLTVVLAVGANYLADILLTMVLPADLMEIAPTVLLITLIALILVGSLKLLSGLAIAAANPIIGGLYTFFFSNIIGKELARALVTTALLTALVVALNMLGLTLIPIAASALTAYIPLLFVVLVLWYIVGHIL